jgi:glycosyltransferase 2 family protein
MFADKPKFKNWVAIAAICSFVVFALYFFSYGDLGQIIGVIGKVSVPLYILAFVCVLGSATFNALTWHQILGKLSIKTRFRRIFALSWVGTFVDAIIPGGWTGDIFKAYLLSRDKGVDGAITAASIVVKKVFETFVSLAALIAGIILLTFSFSLNSQVITAIGVTMVLLSLPMVLILYLSINLDANKKLVRFICKLSRFTKWNPQAKSGLESKLQNAITDFHKGMMTLKTNPKAMIQPVIYQTIAWGFDILTLFIIFASIGYIVSPDKILITNTIAVNLQAQGFALAGVAPIISSALYSTLGIKTLIGLSSSVLTTFPTFWFKVILAFCFFQVIVLNRSLPSIANKDKKQAKFPVT